MVRQEFTELLLDQLKLGLVLFRGDPSGNLEVVFSNAGFSRITGYQAEDLAREGLGILAGEGERSSDFQALFKAHRESRALRAETRLVRSKMETFWGAIELFPVRPDEGVWLLKIEDLSVRRAAEEQLSHDQERLNVTLRAISEGVIITGARMEIDYMNAEAERLTGHTLSRARGKKFADLIRLVGERKREPRSCPVKKVFRGGVAVGPFNDALLVQVKGGERRISYHAEPILAANGRVSGSVVILRDTSGQTLLERELQKVQKMESLALLSEGIAHDFNNLLTGILGNVSLARRQCEEGSRVAAILESAERAANRAKDLTHQLMTFSKGGTSAKRQISIKDLLRESVGFILSGTNCSGRTEIAGDLWPSEVDEGQISQVINNLLINAWQAMPDGGNITVSAQNVTLGGELEIPLSPGSYLRIVVADDGPGIQPDCLGRIFEPYFTTKETGTGLGLATSYSIIKAHSGHIMVHSEVGKGSQFMIYLPAMPHAVAVTGRKASRLYHGKGRVLVMDDEQMIQQITGDMLTHLGYEAEFAYDGAECIERYQLALNEGNPFDVLLLDLTVPGAMGAQECIKQLGTLGKEIRAVVSSGYSSHPVMQGCRQFGFQASIAKPYNIQDLSMVLKQVLQNRAG